MLASQNRKEEYFGLMLVALGVLVRLLPHPDNFTPVTALAFFSGVTLSASIALWVPLLIMMITDIFIGSHSLIFITWGSFFAVSLLGFAVRRHPGLSRIFFGTLAGSVVFFITTNLGVFFFDRMYPMTLKGLTECFVMALPFFRNSVVGDVFYAGVFFGLFALARRFSEKPAATRS